MKRITLLGKRWQLHFVGLGRHRSREGEPVDGLCYPPHASQRKILIDKRLSGQELLRVLLHELSHATNWTIDEDFIEQQSTDMAAVLWDLGYRRKGEGSVTEKGHSNAGG